MRLQSTILLLMCLAFNGHAQIVLNEVCSANRTVLTDDKGNTSDWIELYNEGVNVVDLSEWRISDKPGETAGTQLVGLSIAPGEFLILFASGGNDRGHLDFKVSKEGETLFLSNGEDVVQELRIPSLRDDQSFGRSTSGEYLIFNIPSPGQENLDENGYAFIPSPRFGEEGGIYDCLEEIDLYVEGGFDIRYTLDGSPVTLNSRLYTSPIPFNESLVIAARAFDEKGNTSSEVESFFLKGIHHRLPVAHISADPYLMYDPEDGMLVRGPDASDEFPYYGANFWKDLTAPVRFTWMEEGRVISQHDLEMKVHGGRTSRARTNGMQSLRLTAKGSTGDSKIEGAFFRNDSLQSFENLVLRNASGDFNHLHGRDALLAEYVYSESLNVDLLRARAVAVYLNGQYYGMMHLRQKFDEDYLEERYQISSKTVDIIEKDTLALHGDLERYKRDERRILDYDLSVPENYQDVEQRFDLDNFIDYFVIQTVCNNTDWPRNNIKAWSRDVGDTLWRHVLFDMDIALGRRGWTQVDLNYLTEYIDTLSDAPFYDMFLSLMKNPIFEQKLATRYQDLLNTTFSPNEWLPWMSREIEKWRSEVRRQLNRWDAPDLNIWESQKSVALDYVSRRADLSFGYLQNYLGANAAIPLHLRVEPIGSGGIQVNTVEINTFPWNGRYYPDYPIKLMAIPRENQSSFLFWQNERTGEQRNEKELTVFSDEENEWTAHFTDVDLELTTSVYPNPCSQYVYIDALLPDNGEVELRLIDPLGRILKLYTYPKEYAGPRSFEISVMDLPEGYVTIELTLNGHRARKQVLVKRG